MGLEVLFRVDESAEGGHALVMVGWPGAAWHLELVHDPGDLTPATPTEEDLLVLYLGGEAGEDVIGRLVDAGGTRSLRAIRTGTSGGSRSPTQTDTGSSCPVAPGPDTARSPDACAAGEASPRSS